MNISKDAFYPSYYYIKMFVSIKGNEYHAINIYYLYFSSGETMTVEFLTFMDIEYKKGL